MHRNLRDLLVNVGYQIELLFRVTWRLNSVPKRHALIAEQLYQSGIKVLHVVLLVGLVIGMIVALQTGLELRDLGQQNQIGTIVALSMCREMGPFITAIILAATVGGALAAELGTMAVNEELAALEVMSIDKLRFLVMPRMVALAIVCPLLTVLCDTVGIIGGGLIAESQLNVSTCGYYNKVVLALQSGSFLFDLPKDVYSGLLKSFIFGTAIGLISCSAGLQATAGAIGVGNATRRAVLESIVAIIMANYFLSWLFFQA